MKFNPDLIPGTLLKRYKRFFADVKLDSGETVTAHCPNSGSMKGCNMPGSRVYVQPSDNPKRKLKFTWELLEVSPQNVIGINTLRTNRLVEEALLARKIFELNNYKTLKREVRYGEKSRIDFLLTIEDQPTYLEVKNVSLVEREIACFPDAVTTRGQKHLQELMKVVASGGRGIIFFLINRQDARLFKPAEAIDPTYASLLKEAFEKGVEILVYQTRANRAEICIDKPVPFDLT